MYVLQVLNSNDEWELCIYLFESYEDAEQYYQKNMDVFDGYMIAEMRKY